MLHVIKNERSLLLTLLGSVGMHRKIFALFIIFFGNVKYTNVYGQQILLPAPKIVSLIASNPSTASGDISFYNNGCQMTITFDTNTDTG